MEKKGDRIIKKIFFFVSALTLVWTLNGPSHAIQFEEVTDTTGISFSGGSWGASWGDFNGDGKPDIWVSGCSTSTRFRLNNGDGTFTDASGLIVGVPADTHGVAWADFDIDGDQDLLQLAGAQWGVGSGPNQLFVNTGSQLEDRAFEYGVDYPLGRGRTPLWLDWNRDGDLDVFLANLRRTDGQAPSALFTQRMGSFVNDNSLTGIETLGDNTWAQLTHLTGEQTPVLLINGYPYPGRAYEMSCPFWDIINSLGLPRVYNVIDSVMADVDGDLVNDIFMVRSVISLSEVQVDGIAIRSAIRAPGLERGFHFKTQGDVGFNIPEAGTAPRIEDSTLIPLSIDDIYIGQDGYHPSDFEFTLVPAAAVGLCPHNPGGNFGIFIGYDPIATSWQVLVSGFARSTMIVESITPILDLETIGFTNWSGALEDRLYVYKMERFEDMTAQSGLDAPSACRSTAAADFDNDLDIDLYLVCRSPVGNLPNRLYENLGDGTFVIIPNGGGAEGSTIGRGDSVASADYDEDGFVDLFVTNGLGYVPFDNGPDQLFRNLGSDNNWLEIDLEGTASNRDGIGAQLFITAAGVTQFREQVGGMHAKSQNYQRIHFGLAQNDVVDNLIVAWPSGIRHEITNIPTNQIIRVVEPNAPEDLSSQRVICDDQYIPPEDYWTPERMRDAVPPPMGIEVGEPPAEICDDGDGFIDCDDSDCADDPACTATPPPPPPESLPDTIIDLAPEKGNQPITD